MEIFLTILFWGAQIGITVGIALLLGWLWKRGVQAIRRKSVRLLPRVLIVLALLCILLARLAWKPPVYCREECRDKLTADMETAALDVGRGLWSRKFPQVPLCVEITGIDGEEVLFRVHYLYFFNLRYAVQYSWSPDGYDRISQWMT